MRGRPAWPGSVAWERAHQDRVEAALLVAQMSLALFPNEGRLTAFAEALKASSVTTTP
jgi:hypothetical protein